MRPLLTLPLLLLAVPVGFIVAAVALVLVVCLGALALGGMLLGTLLGAAWEMASMLFLGAEPKWDHC